MRLLLIMPSSGEEFYGGVAPLSLATIAGLTPPDVEVQYADTVFDELDYDAPVDLVAITVMTQHAPDAYAIATQFRIRGVPVVLGGIHPSALPEEAQRFADAVVIGEAEGVWPELVEDVRRGRLRKTYKAESLSDLRHSPLPRLDIFPPNRYRFTNVIQATRGCPFDCEFCTVTSYWGRTYRHKPVEQIVREIERLPRAGPVFFVDDNIAGDPGYAKSLFRAIAPYRLHWVSQASVTMAMDEELLGLAQSSGCFLLLVGLESMQPSNLESMGKRVNRADHFAEHIARFHAHGIGVIGAFVFGYDYDDRSVLDSTIQFAEQTHLEFMQLTAITPFPGSRLRERLEREGRIIDGDWRHYTCTRAVFQPKLLSPAELEEERERALRRFYSFGSIYRRLIRGPQPWRRYRYAALAANLARVVSPGAAESTGPAEPLLKPARRLMRCLADRTLR